MDFQIDELKLILVQEFPNMFYHQIIDHSDKHFGHSGNPDNKAHLELILVDDIFEEMRPLARQRLIMSLCKGFFEDNLHALELHLFSEKEWKNESEKFESS